MPSHAVQCPAPGGLEHAHLGFIPGSDGLGGGLRGGGEGAGEGELGVECFGGGQVNKPVSWLRRMPEVMPQTATSARDTATGSWTRPTGGAQNSAGLTVATY